MHDQQAIPSIGGGGRAAVQYQEQETQYENAASNSRTDGRSDGEEQGRVGKYDPPMRSAAVRLCYAFLAATRPLPTNKREASEVVKERVRSAEGSMKLFNRRKVTHILYCDANKSGAMSAQSQNVQRENIRTLLY